MQPTTHAAINNKLSVFLDAARWVSATLVVVTHLNNRMFIRFAAVSVDDRSVGLYFWTFICGFAHHAVVVFFVLSGFLVGGKLLRERLVVDRDYITKYLADRISRIYTVLIPVLILTAILDNGGYRLLNGAGFILGKILLVLSR